MSPSSRGLGHRPFTAVTGVRLPLGTPYKSTAYSNVSGFFMPECGEFVEIRLKQEAKHMTIEEAIHIHGAIKVFEAGAAGECEDYAPLQALGREVETIAGAELISHAAYDRLTVEEKAANYWEASQDMHKDREPVDWHGMDDVSISPRMSDESEAEYLHRQILGELIKEQLEKRRSKQV
jgi:hypothetical protein